MTFLCFRRQMILPTCSHVDIYNRKCKSHAKSQIDLQESLQSRTDWIFFKIMSIARFIGIKEARAGCGLKKRLREFFFIFAYVIFMVFRVYLCAKNHTSP